MPVSKTKGTEAVWSTGHVPSMACPPSGQILRRFFGHPRNHGECGHRPNDAIGFARNWPRGHITGGAIARTNAVPPALRPRAGRPLLAGLAAKQTVIQRRLPSVIPKVCAVALDILRHTMPIQA